MREKVAFVLLAGIAGFAACSPAVERQPPEQPFQNVSVDVPYVGDAVCAQCHGDLARSYETHGMAQSYHPLTVQNVGEAWSGEAIYHAPSNLYYRAYREGDRFFQEEYRIGGDGQRTHHLVREARYVMGSGSAARTYLTEINGWQHQLPLTWYTQEQRWDFSPGYRQANARFDRLVPDRCMACHNAYPDAAPFTDGKYNELPDGISCERCHGPGALHADARLSEEESPDSVDYTIVNPAHLPLERQLDVCGQCHLQSAISILREGQGAFDYRPGQPLDGYQSLFTPAGREDEGSIRVISHGERMQRSPCFIQSGTMNCVTCHDPHEGFRDKGPAYFNVTCQTCHPAAALAEQFDGTAEAINHQPASNCTSCHMPKVASTEAPHSSFTDHWIRVVREVPPPPTDSTGDVQLVPYYERDREGDEAAVYEGMAYVVYGQQRADADALRQGAEKLDVALDGKEGFGEAHYLLGFARYQLGQARAAIPALETAQRLGPDIPERLNTLALAYEATGASADRVLALYERALQVQPALADVRVNYGRYLERIGRLDAAAAQYAQAVEERPWLETAHYNLGTLLLRQGALGRAEAQLQQAILLDPDNARARGNLGLLYASQNKKEQARVQFEAAAEADPQSAVALGNLGTFYLNESRYDRAQPLLERAVTLDPAYLDGLVNLALLHLRENRPAEARAFAVQALRVNPGDDRARQILGALGG